jgi:hypothetical protein
MNDNENTERTDMLDYLKTVVSWLNLKPSTLLAIGITCIVIVAIPETWQCALGYGELIKSAKGYVGLVGLASTVFGLTKLLFGCISSQKELLLRKWRKWRLGKNAPTILRSLSRQEKEYLARYINRDITSLEFDLSDGTIRTLQAKKIVYQGSNVSLYHTVFSFNLQPWVQEAFKQHPDLKKDILSLHKDKIRPL